MEIKVKAGDKAPDFEGPTSDGSRLGLKNFVGKKNVVLYFYPKDDTPGCTRKPAASGTIYNQLETWAQK